MAIPSRQIGWGTESNLLWQILKQLNKLTSVLFGLKEAATPKYKVYTALLSQSGGNNPIQTSGDEAIIKGVTYIITSNPDNIDISSIGAPNNNVGTTFVSTRDASGEFSTTIKLDSNTGAPTAIVLENTIGNIWFDYRNPGQYRIYSDSQFIQNKTFAFTAFPGTTNSGGSAAIYVNQVPEHLSMETRDYAGSSSDDILYETSIEIRVYN